jgi:hypothetical protein
MGKYIDENSGIGGKEKIVCPSPLKGNFEKSDCLKLFKCSEGGRELVLMKAQMKIWKIRCLTVVSSTAPSPELVEGWIRR